MAIFPFRKYLAKLGAVRHVSGPANPDQLRRIGGSAATAMCFSPAWKTREEMRAGRLTSIRVAGQKGRAGKSLLFQY